jgi:hypothetical protein
MVCDFNKQSKTSLVGIVSFLVLPERLCTC